MMYSYFSFEDETTILYSELLINGKVLVNFRRILDGTYQSASYELPGPIRLSVDSFSEPRLKEFEAYLTDHQREIFQVAAIRLKESIEI